MSKDYLAVKLINVCAWCGREQYGVFDDAARTTHGICEDCLESLREDRKSLLNHE